jgi:SRSO17 transposase
MARGRACAESLGRSQIFRACAEDTPRPPWDTLPWEHSSAGAPQRQFVGQDGERPADHERAEAAESCVWDLQAPSRWGLSAEAISTVGERLDEFWLRCRDCFKPRTRDTRANAYNYLRAQGTMDNERHLANLARHLTGAAGQALQHFLSNAPWAGQAVFGPMPAELKATAVLAQGSTLRLAERADEKAGTPTAGASRPDHGRMGKGDVGRGDPCLPYATGGLWAMVDGALCLPEEWWGAAVAPRRPELGSPAEGRFETTLPVGLKRVKRVKAPGLPCDLLAGAALYGRDRPFRAAVEAAGVGDAAQVPAAPHVYLSEPRVGVPEKRGQRGRPRTRLHVLSRQRPPAVRALAPHPQPGWQQVVVRPTARRRWAADFALQRGWTVAGGTRPRAEGLVIRRDAEGDCSYTLLHAPEEAPHAHLIAWRCRRDFAERTFEEAKTEIGWDECQAQQDRAWEHHVALTAAALWCIAQTKLAWAQAYRRAPEGARQWAGEVLPALSTANVRELLKAVFPWPQLTLEQATGLGIMPLVNRARSTSSRLKSQMKLHDSS